MRPFAPLLLAPAIASVLAACTPQGSRVARVAIGLRDVAAAIPGATALDLDVVGPEMPPVRASLPLDGSTAIVEVPAGPARVFLLRAFAAGVLTHQGSTTADLVAGREQTITIRLEPVDTGIPPPAILSRTPADGATGVATSTVVTVTFAEAVDPATVTAASFTLVDAAATPVPATVSVSGAVATLTPDAPLAPLTAYTATIGGVRAFAGSDATPPSRWAFTTAAPSTGFSCAAPEPLHDAEAFAFHATPIGPDGDLLAIGATRATPNAVFSWRYRAGSGWSTPEIISDPANLDATVPVALAGNEQGDAVAAWQHIDVATSTVTSWARRWDGATGTWTGAPALVQAGTCPPYPCTGARHSIDLTATMDGNGDATALWIEEAAPGASYEVFARRWTKAGGLEPAPAQLSTAAEVAFGLHAGAGVGGTVVATWNAFDGMRTRAWRGSVWNVLESFAGRQVEAIAVADDGAAMTIWEDGLGAVNVARSGPGPDDWGPVRQLWSSGNRPVLAGDAQGRVIAAWHDRLSGTMTAATFDPADATGTPTGWTDPLSIDLGDANNVYLIAGNRAGEVVAGEERMDAIERPTASVRAFDPSTGWNPEGIVDVGEPSNSRLLALAVDPLGRSTVFWGRRDTGLPMASRCGFGPDVGPPRVTAVSPLPDATDVPTDAVVTATFSEPVDPATVSAATFTLTGPGGSAVAASIAVSGNTATSTPATLAAGTTYTATVTAQVADLAGNPLATPVTWSFTTGSAADTTPPFVTSTVPADGATGVASSTLVVASFSEPLDPATVGAATFTLDGPAGAVAALAVTLSPDGLSATFTPVALAAGATYTATVTTGVKDLAGNPMTTDASWSFTTTAGGAGWEPPVAIGPAAGIGTGGRIAVDDAGDAVAVWTQYEGAEVNLRANRYSSGSGWGAAELLESDPGRVSEVSVSLAGNGAGDATAVWSQQDASGHSRIYAARLSPGTGWGAPVLVQSTDPPLVDAGDSKVGVDAAGNAVAAWYWGGNVVASRFVPGAGWGGDAFLTDQRFSANNFELAVGAGGDAIAVWSESDGSRFPIWANRFTPGAGWGTAAPIDPPNGGNADFPHVAIDGSGNALAVWHELAGGRYSVWSARLTPGGGWGAPVLVELEDTAHASEPRIAVDGAGNAVAIWRQSTPAGPYDLWANRFTPGAGWGTPELIEAGSGSIAARSYSVAMRGGVAMVVWEQASGGRTSIWSNRSAPGSGWSGPVLVETDDGGDAWSPRTAVDAAGGAFAVWEQQQGSAYRILSSRFR